MGRFARGAAGRDPKWGVGESRRGVAGVVGGYKEEILTVSCV